MNLILNNRTSAKVVAAVVFGLAMALSFAVPAHAITQAEATAIITALGLTGPQAAVIQALVTSSPSSSSCSFTRDLTVGASGADVTCLQNALIASGYSIPAGATGYFGSQTKSAVMKWQAAAGVSPVAGYFGPKSRAAFGSTSTNPNPTPTPAGTGLTVSGGTQPANSLAPQGAMRVPFTTFTLTAGNDGDVTVNGVTIQRTGLGADAVFNGVVLIDQSTGAQLDIAKTFNSNHQATVGGTFTVPRGTSRSFLVAGNMASSLTGHQGEAPSISVVGINTSAVVSGSLPIVGASQTANNTLSVGAITLATSNAFATNATSTQNLGVTDYKFTGVRLTASSAEDLTLLSIRFNQTGSASASDMANVKIVVNGTAYPAVVSADGRYFMASLGSGVLITKGNQVEVYIQGDIVGTNSSSRTIKFDIDKSSDIYAKGNIYGYGAPVSGGAPGTPYFYGVTTTVQGASVTTIQKDNAVAAQNIAINLANQPLGGFSTSIVGEAITVQGMTFTVSSSSGSAGDNLTSVSLVDENGSVVAGPVDEADVANGGNAIVFTDTVTFPAGTHHYTLRGKVASGTTNGATITVSTNPSSSWTSPKGNTTGNAITLSQTSFAMNTMTVKAGAVTLSIATSPSSQTLVPGGVSVLMSNIAFDASQSGEDIRFASAPIKLLTGSVAGDESNLTNCQLFDGSMALNNNSVLNPSTSTATSTTDFYTGTVSLDNPVTVAKGSVKTLGLRCNIASGADNNSTFQWDVQAVANWTFSGATSGTTITGSNSTTDSPVTVTVGSGSATVATDAASPGYTIASAGSTGITEGAFRFRSSNEDINLTKLGLTITSSASSSDSDIVKASIYDGSTKVGEAFFSSGATVATSTFTTPVTLVKATDKTLTVKLDIASIGASGTGAPNSVSGHLVALDYLNAEGTGASSGSTFLMGAATAPGGGGSTSVAGVRIFKSFPTLSQETLASTGAADGKLLRFRVTADANGPVGLSLFHFTLATSTSGTLVTNINLFGFTDSSYSQPISGVSTGGQFLPSNLCAAGCDASGQTFLISAQTAANASTTVQVPAGQTRYFELRGSVTTVTGSSIVTTLLGDSAFPAVANSGFAGVPMVRAASTTLTARSFIWSPNSTTTSAVGDVDWTDGFGLPGLPSGGIVQSRSN